jgi:hypothetical protein
MSFVRPDSSHAHMSRNRRCKLCRCKVADDYDGPVRFRRKPSALMARASSVNSATRTLASNRRSPILLVAHRTHEIAGILLLAFDFDSACGKPVEISGTYRTRRLWNRLELDQGTAVARNDDALALQCAVYELGEPVLGFRHTVCSHGHKYSHATFCRGGRISEGGQLSEARHQRSVSWVSAAPVEPRRSMPIALPVG